MKTLNTIQIDGHEQDAFEIYMDDSREQTFGFVYDEGDAKAVEGLIAMRQAVQEARSMMGDNEDRVVPIDDKYAFQVRENGTVDGILRHNERWIARDEMPAPKMMIATAFELDRLRGELEMTTQAYLDLHTRNETLSAENQKLDAECERLDAEAQMHANNLTPFIVDNESNKKRADRAESLVERLEQNLARLRERNTILSNQIIAMNAKSQETTSGNTAEEDADRPTVLNTPERDDQPLFINTVAYDAVMAAYVGVYADTEEEAAERMTDIRWMMNQGVKLKFTEGGVGSDFYLPDMDAMEESFSSLEELLKDLGIEDVEAKEQESSHPNTLNTRSDDSEQLFEAIVTQDVTASAVVRVYARDLEEARERLTNPDLLNQVSFEIDDNFWQDHYLGDPDAIEVVAEPPAKTPNPEQVDRLKSAVEHHLQRYPDLQEAIDEMVLDHMANAGSREMNTMGGDPNSTPFHLVMDAAETRASRINNGGIRTQIDWLVQEIGFEATREQIQQAAQELSGNRQDLDQAMTPDPSPSSSTPKP